ncbi:DUF2948 family protein [Aureimonas sp. AU4]|uniref:DUF2948 family protein n=1 Tax=Aureimonas sp. AU4 TaxID=1638163 RepID=UPI0007817B24|nr:DUF2948 family protein [Aureimonas sp. AU4]
MDLLRLMALDDEDLAILSAHAQDGVARLGDLVYLPAEKQFAVGFNRFRWERATARRRWFGRPVAFERRRSALHFDRVLAVRRQNLPADPDAVLALLAIRWHPGAAPSGTVELVFAGQGAIRLDVECIEAQLADLGPAWDTLARPDHDRG